MKINPIQLYKGIQQSGQVGKKEKNESSKSVSYQQKDQVTFSLQAKLFSSALQHAKEAEDIREDKILKIQDKIHNGTYSIKGSDIAQRMLTGAGGIAENESKKPY